MSKQVNSFILPDNIIKDMKNKIKETKNAKIELGFALCIDKNENIVRKGSDCIGTKCSIKVGKCSENQRYIGNYHTHPRSYATMSINDMATGCSEDIECIGAVPFNNIRCFTRKTDESQCFHEVIPFEESEHKIIERGEKIRSVLKNPISIIKIGPIKILRDIYQYDTDMAKYHTNRAKLLNNNFNKTDI